MSYKTITVDKHSNKAQLTTPEWRFKDNGELASMLSNHKNIPIYFCGFPYSNWDHGSIIHPILYAMDDDYTIVIVELTDWSIIAPTFMIENPGYVVMSCHNDPSNGAGYGYKLVESRCIPVVTGDEGSVYPWHYQLSCHQLSFKCNYSSQYEKMGVTIIPIESRLGFYSLLSSFTPWHQRQYKYSFVGGKKPSRVQLIEQLEKNSNGYLQSSDNFGGSLSMEQYAKIIGNTKIAPCPDGNMLCETFRHFEALDMGCIIVSCKTSKFHRLLHRTEDAWQWLAKFTGEEAPFVWVEDWQNINGMIDSMNDDLMLILHNRTWNWWLRTKVLIGQMFLKEYHTLRGIPPVTTTVNVYLVNSGYKHMWGTIDHLLSKCKKGDIIYCDLPENVMEFEYAKNTIMEATFNKGIIVIFSTSFKEEVLNKYCQGRPFDIIRS
jgi:hypothetical protein